MPRFGFGAFFAASLFAFFGTMRGQEPRPRAAVFVELAGNSLLGVTGNLELHLGSGIGVRVGAGQDFYTGTRVVPLQAVVLLGSGHSKLELAAGVIIAREAHLTDWPWNGTKTFFTGFVGYRHQRPRGFLVRIGVVPMFWTDTKAPWVALGLGTTF